jgi:hypothetical protein
MNMFMLQTKPQWGLLVGFGSVLPPAVLLVLGADDPRTDKLCWLMAVVIVLVGAGAASLLALRRTSTGLGEAARLGAFAWICASIVVSLTVFFFNPFVILTVPIAAVIGAIMGTLIGALMKGAGIAVAPPARIPRRRRPA